jgi:L-aspartate oxidase
MSRDASVVRDEHGLRRLDDLLSTAKEQMVADRTGFEDAALTLAARVVTGAALSRTESRGCHHRAEYFDVDPGQARSTTVRLRDDAVVLEAPTAVAS